MTRLLSFGRLLLFAFLVGGLSIGLVACDSGGSGMEEEKVEVSVEGVVVDATGKDALLAKSGRPSQVADENQDRDPETVRPDEGQRPGDVSARADTLAEGDQRPQDAPKIEDQSARPLQEDGDPIEGAEVGIYLPNEDSPEATATTESDGSYKLTFSISEENVPEDLVLEAETDRFKTYTSTIDFGRSITYDVALEELDGYVASGVVTDRHGAGIGDVEIELQGTGATTETDANGRWEQGGLEGTVTAVPEKEDYTFEPGALEIDGPTEEAIFEGTLEVDPPEEGEADIELDESAKVADDHTADQLAGYEDGRLLFEKSTTFLENVEEGDVIALEPNDEVGEDEFIWVVTGDLTDGENANLAKDGLVDLPADLGNWFDLFPSDTPELGFEFNLSKGESIVAPGVPPGTSISAESDGNNVNVKWDNLLLGEGETDLGGDVTVVDGALTFESPTLETDVTISPDGLGFEVEDLFVEADFEADGFLEMEGEVEVENDQSFQVPLSLLFKAGALDEVIKDSLVEQLKTVADWLGGKLAEFLGAELIAEIFFEIEVDAQAEFHTITHVDGDRTASIGFGEGDPDVDIDATDDVTAVCSSLDREIDMRMGSGGRFGFYLEGGGNPRGGEVTMRPLATDLETRSENGQREITYLAGPNLLVEWNIFGPGDYSVLDPIEIVTLFSDPTPVGYTDAAFEEAVRAEIPVPSIESRDNRTEDKCPLYPSDVGELTSLDASEQDVESVVGIDAMASLTDADLASNSLTDLDPLVDLATSSANLTEVDLRDNPTLDTTPGSDAREAIETLKSEGVTVYYDEPEGTEVTISGTITDEEGGDPIEGATVTGADADTDEELFETETEASGEYEVTFTVDNEPNEVAVEADAEGYEAAEETIPFGEEMTADLTLSGGPAVYSASYPETHKVTPDGEREWVYGGHTHRVSAVAVDANGYVYTGSTGDEVHKLTPDGEREWSYSGHSDGVFGVAVDADRYVYTASIDEEVHKLTPDGEREWTYSEHTDWVLGVAVDADGNVYTASADEEVHKLTPDGEREWSYSGHSDDVLGLAVDADGNVYTASADEEVRKLTPDGEHVWSYSGHSEAVEGVAVDANGYVYTGSIDEEVHKLTPDGEREWAYRGHSSSAGDGSVHEVGVDAYGNVYTASADDEVHKLTPGGEREWAYIGHPNDVWGVAVDPGAFWVSQGLVD